MATVAPPSAYFDTNVYDHIDKGQIPDNEFRALQSALQDRVLTARLSLADVEELLGQWNTDRDAAVRKLKVARDLVGFDGLLKPPNELLTLAIDAYTRGWSPPSPFLDRRTRQHLAKRLDKVARGGRSFLDPAISTVVADVKAKKEAYLQGMTEGDAEASANLHGGSSDRPEPISWPTFAAFWEQAAPLWAEDLVERRFGNLVDACRERGIDGLLDVRPMRVAVGICLSLVFSHVVEGVEPSHTDGYDIWHAVLGSTADLFVTCDQCFANHLERLPATDGFRVFRSVSALLAHLERPS